MLKNLPVVMEASTGNLLKVVLDTEDTTDSA
jgi:hypothetical protein